MVNEIIAEAVTTVAAAAVLVPVYLGVKGLIHEDSTKCQTIGEYGRQALGLDPTPDYARIRKEQARRRILG